MCREISVLTVVTPSIRVISLIVFSDLRNLVIFYSSNNISFDTSGNLDFVV